MREILDLFLIIGFILFLSIPFILTFYLVTSVIAVLLGAPFVPARKEAIQAMLKLSQAKPGMKIADLGSGDGRVVRALAASGAYVEGYEIQPLLVWWSRIVSRLRGLSGSTSFYVRNLYTVDYSEYDVVIVYGFPKMIDKLSAKFKQELKPGTMILMLDFDLPGWESTAVEAGVYAYTVDPKLMPAATAPAKGMISLGT